MNWKVRRFLKHDFETIEEIEDKYEIISEIESEEQLFVIGDWRKNIIKYDRMQGKPIVTIKIKGHEMECLLDTGATVYVMSWERIK